jgi:hypothetical protein
MRMLSMHSRGLVFFCFFGFGLGGFFSFISVSQCGIIYSDHVLKGFPPCVLQDVPNSTSVLSHVVWTQFNFHV